MFCIIIIYFPFRIVFLELVASIFPSIWLLHYLFSQLLVFSFLLEKVFGSDFRPKNQRCFKIQWKIHEDGSVQPFLFSTIQYIIHLSLNIRQYSFLYGFLYHYVKPQEENLNRLDRKKKKRVLRININVKREYYFKQIQPNGFPRLLGSVQLSWLDILEGFSDFLP